MKRLSKFLLLSAVFCFSSCKKSPWEKYNPPADLSELNPETEATVDLKVISLGINNKNADYAAIEELIKAEKADLVVLREVDKNNKRSGIDINQAELIADRVGMKYVFAPQLDNYQEGQFGLAILSKLPIKESWVAKLPVDPVLKGDERPLAFMKLVYKANIDIVFLGVHLDDGSNKARRIQNKVIQAQAIMDYIKDLKQPTIVAGNFFFQNEGDDALPALLSESLISPCKPCLGTITQHGAEFVADHILFRNIPGQGLIDYRVGAVISQRKPVVASFKLSKK